MEIPVLMPFQMSPMNGDHLITDEILRLKERFGLSVAIETGTCFGSTSLWMAKHFTHVLTIENNEQYQAIAKERAKNDGIGNIIFYLGNSKTLLLHVMDDLKRNTSKNAGNAVFFLDAHWEKECPLMDELKAIAIEKVKPVIVIHDMKNPDDARFGFDKYNGQEFTFEWVKPSLDRIYGEDGYTHYFNTGFKKESAQRGVLYCHPKL